MKKHVLVIFLAVFSAVPVLADEEQPLPTVEDVTESVLQSLLGIWQTFLERIPFLVAGVIVLLLSWLTVTIASSIVKKAKSAEEATMNDLK